MAAAEPSKPDVFLSYAREDEARARDLATALGREGCTVFWDREVPPGETWHSYIGEALANAKCVVVAWSRHSIASQWVIEEASEGKDRNALVPVMFEVVQPPFGFRAIQAASLVAWRPGRPSPAFDALLAAVRRIVGGRPGSGAEPAPSDEPSPEPVRPRPRQTSTRSYRSLAAMIAGLIAIAGAGSVGVYWWRTQTKTSPTPGPSIVAETKPAAGPETPSRTAADTPEPGGGQRDCEQCPEMVVVPPGEFVMGSPPNERGRSNDEGPQHKVTIPRSLAVGKYEVTFAEWDACVAARGCSHKPGDGGWGRGNQPVINVTWNDAQEYVSWLSKKTGKVYRLLTEAEWEYVARAGSTTTYWWGDEIGRDNANCNGCGSRWDGKQTAPVGRFAANHFGLHDTAGNVWEWVQDCYHSSYDGAPEDGSAWEDGGSCDRVLRGGSWVNGPRVVRSAARRYDTGSRSSYFGLRVARTAD